MASLSEYSFRSDIASTINLWPDPIDGAWNWIKRAFSDLDFVLHATIERRKLEAEYFSDPEGRILTQIADVRKAFERNLDAAAKEARSLLDARERSLKANDGELQVRRERHQAELQDLNGFKKTYQGMKDALQQCREQIREISREE